LLVVGTAGFEPATPPPKARSGRIATWEVGGAAQLTAVVVLSVAVRWDG
jgi:hypothetical protein